MIGQPDHHALSNHSCPSIGFATGRRLVWLMMEKTSASGRSMIPDLRPVSVNATELANVTRPFTIGRDDTISNTVTRHAALPWQACRMMESASLRSLMPYLFFGFCDCKSFIAFSVFPSP